MNEDEIMVIYDYINENLFAPAQDWPEYQFRKRSYERWAADEMMKRITETPEVDPFIVVLYFRNQMDNLSGIREKSDAEFIFLTARDTADEIIQLF